MKNLTLVLLFVTTTLFSTVTLASQEWCSTGSKGGMTNTAYTMTELDWWEYYIPGYFYGMLVSVDLGQNIRGQGAYGWWKSSYKDASAVIWIARVDSSGAYRKAKGSGGLSPYDGDTCQSAFTQIFY